MVHRVTWYAAGVLALTAIASTVGYWGFGQMNERNALVRSADTAYGASFEDLVANVAKMRNQMADSLLTSNQTMFDSHLAGISRFAYAAETDLSKLPANAESMTALHSYLNGIDSSARAWLSQPSSVSDATVHKSLSSAYAESGKVENELNGLQGQLSSNTHQWVLLSGNHQVKPTAIAAMQKVNADILSADAASSTSNNKNTMPHIAATAIRKQQAIQLVQRAAGRQKVDNWTSKIANSPTSGSVYEVWGKLGNQPDVVHGVVSRENGKLLSFHNARSIGKNRVDITEAAKIANTWLRNHGYSDVKQMDAAQYDGKAVLTFEPVYGDATVFDHALQVYVALDNGNVVGFNGQQAALNPVKQVLKPKLRTAELRSRLSHDFHIQMERSVLMQQGDDGVFAPATAFYGTLKDQTFCVFLSAINGQELQVQHLS